jgi:hypothetical protein
MWLRRCDVDDSPWRFDCGIVACRPKGETSMAIFYSVVEDDPLDSGGTSRVIEGSPSCTIQGDDGRVRNQTFLGQKAWCDACKSIGVIVAAPGSPDGLRMHDWELNAHEALGGDLVFCNCKRPPRIISVHGRSCMIIDDGCESAVAGTPIAAASAAQSARQQFDDRYVLRDANGAPLRNMRYMLRRGEGPAEGGTTDDKGQTHLLATVASKEEIHLYLGSAV